ncbi:MAG: histone deacetylase [Pseudomonadota bacterium]
MLPIIHHPDYDAASVTDDHRFPMRKYSLVAELLATRGFQFERPDHASQATLERVHDPKYVHAVLTSSLDAKTARRVGFEMTPAIAARTRASVGGTARAAERALEAGRAVNLAGGSHHADYQGGAGFCVFNDVAVAALSLLDRERAHKIAVIDLDVHHGDGTALIFADEPRVFTASLHCKENWPRTKPPSDLDISLRKGTGDRCYLNAAQKLVSETLSQAQPDLVFYNAGVDPHTDDRLGLLDLSDDGLKARDAMVVQACLDASVPVVGVLGGGYSKDARLVAHRHTYLVEAMQIGL